MGCEKVKNKDDDILYWANECRLVTRAHLARLTGRNNSWLHESLRRMVKQKKLYCRTRGRWLPMVYATHDIRRRETFDHDLALTDIHIAVYSTGRLKEWNQPVQKIDGAVNEDTLFHLAYKDSSIKYYLEYETGKNAWYQVDDKFRRYLELRGKDRFHVLFILKDEERKTVAQLTRRAQKFLSKEKPASWKLFLFTTLEQITANPQGRICNVANTSERFPFAPNE